MKRCFTKRVFGLAGLAGLVLVSAFAGGCNAFGSRISDADVKRIDRARIQAWRRGEPTVLLLDVRSQSAFQRRHIKGAIHAPLPSLRPGEDRWTGSDKRLVVYGQNARDSLAPAAAKKLLSQDYANVYVLSGGLKGWRQAGGAVTAAGGGSN